ncbi:hypothetical protein PVAP13_9KG435800 [Panicum virgatum]|uniref:Uncharacterized protein n=1 Tax=Panicum virgatum TaxID=38727 RepID=A0A8T0NUX0_PANVG|nr:hypothetical protein PVAP13_9KG435800 [Panicum virgatum]
MRPTGAPVSRGGEVGRSTPCPCRARRARPVRSRNLEPAKRMRATPIAGAGCARRRFPRIIGRSTAATAAAPRGPSVPLEYWRGSGRRRAHGGSRAGRWIVSSCHAALLYGRQIEGSIVKRTVRAGWIEDSNGRGRQQPACL